MKLLIVVCHLALSSHGTKRQPIKRPVIQLEIDAMFDHEEKMIQAGKDGDLEREVEAWRAWEDANNEFTKEHLNITLEEEDKYLILYPL